MNSQKEFNKIVKQLTELRAKKNHDYGDAFLKTYNQYGNKALFFDLLRKFQRLENILVNDKTIKVSDETLEDTLGDIAVMAMNGMIWKRFMKRK